MRAALLALAILLSGCLGGASTTKGIDGFEDGAIVRGLVTDDELLPVANALVGLIQTELDAYTDEAGRFEISDVPSGEWTLMVHADGHEGANATVLVEEGARVDVQLRIARVGAIVPHQVPFVFPGKFDCGHEIPIWTGDCLIAYNAATGQNDTQTAEKFHFRLPIGDGWESIVLELVWQQAANNQLDGMRLYLENANGTEQGHSYKVGRVDGPQNPLGFVVHRGQPHPRADTYDGTSTKAFIPDEGENAQVRVYPRGKLYETTSQVETDRGPLLGVGVGVNIEFTVYATVFYHGRAPDGFSGRPDQ